MPTKFLKITPGSTSWRVIGMNGGAYSSVAALIAAGDVGWPNTRDAGSILAVSGEQSAQPTITMKAWASGGATDGSNFSWSRDTLTAPAAGFQVEGSNQGFTINASGIYYFWVQMGSATDLLYLYYYAP